MKLKKIIKDFLYFVLQYSGYLNLRSRYLFMVGNTWCTVLLYHRVDPSLEYDPIDINIHPDEFMAQMKALKKNYNVISVSELLDVIKTKSRFPPRAVCITFDDSYRSIYKYAFPVLKQLDLPACFFLNDGYLNTDRVYPWDSVIDSRQEMMTWEEARSIIEQGYEIGVHTTNHPDLASVDIEEAQSEIYGSKLALEKGLGRQLRFFSIPTGKKENYNNEIIDIVKKGGFSCCFTAYGGVVIPDSNVFGLKRMSFSNDYWSVNEFCADIDRLF